MVSKKVLLLTSIFALQTFAAYAAVEKRLFTLEKSYNPENILVIHTQTDENCNFIAQNGEYLNLYWLMNGTTKKEVHPTIRTQVKGRVSFEGINDRKNSFTVRFNDLNELKHDIEDPTIEISSSFSGSECKVESIITLGASANHRRLNLTRTYCEVKTNALGIPNGCKFIDLEGRDADNNEALKVRFAEKKK